MEAKIDDVKGIAENIGIMKTKEDFGFFKGTQHKFMELGELSAGTIGVTSWTNDAVF